MNLQKQKENLRNNKRFKIGGEIWLPGEIWFFALYVYGSATIRSGFDKSPIMRIESSLLSNIVKLAIS